MGTQIMRDVEVEVEVDTLTIKGDPTKLYEELAKAQAEFLAVPRQSAGQVGLQKFKYAGYATIMRCVRPALSKYGITILQPLHWRDDKAITTTILAGHGASVSSSFAFEAEFKRKQKDGTIVNDPQEFGRAHTYYRRYQLQSMLGIEGDKDADDLPDVNEEREQAQFVEPPKEPEKTAPKASEPAEQKSAPATPKTKPSAEPSEGTKSNDKSKTAAKAEPAKPEAKPEAKPTDVAAVKTVNELILAGMNQLGWKIDDVKVFYKEHVDPAGFEKTGNMTIEQKRTLLNKMVELKNVAPF